MRSSRSRLCRHPRDVAGAPRTMPDGMRNVTSARQRNYEVGAIAIAVRRGCVDKVLAISRDRAGQARYVGLLGR